MLLREQAPVSDRPLRMDDIADPTPGPGQILVEVRACAICRTDLHVVEGELPLLRTPLVPGHQAVGRVAARGPDATRFREGDRVGIAWLRRTCGRCLYCAPGARTLRAGGIHRLARRRRLRRVRAGRPRTIAYAIPAGLGDVQAAPLLCAGIIGYRALKLPRCRRADASGMYGFGSSAHVTIQVARGRGMEVYVCTREPAHRDAGREPGRGLGRRLQEPMPHPPTAPSSSRPPASWCRCRCAAWPGAARSPWRAST